MAQTGPWDKYATQQPVPQPQPPGIIVGQADPYKQSAEARAQQDQAMEAERLRLQREAAARDEVKDQQTIAEKQMELDAGAQAKAIEGERKAAAFLIRALGANESFESTGVGAPSYIGQKARDIAPDAANYATSDARQVANTNQDEFIAASLRQDSGAAIPPEELERQRRIYFPVPGDSPATIEAKRQARIRAIEGLRQSAGRLEGSAEERYARLMQGRDQADALTGTMTPEGGFNVRVTDDSPASPGGAPGGGGRYDLGNIATALGQGAGSIVEGVGRAAGLAIDPIGQALYDALGYNQQYDTGTILREGLGLPDNPNQLNDMIIQGAAAGLTGGLGARGLATITNPGAIQNAFNALGATPTRDAIAGASAAAAGYGAQGYGPVAQFGASVVGGGLGYGGASALTRAPRGIDPVLGAMERQQVDLLPADTGGITTRGLTTAAKASPFSAAPVVNAGKRSQDQMGKAASRIANSQGEIVTTDVAGGKIRDAAERFSRESAERGANMYTKAYRLAEGVSVVPSKTIARLNERIDRLKANPAATTDSIGELERFRDNLTNGVSIEGLRDARTTLSQGTYDGKLRSSADKQMWKEILGDLSSDINEGLREQGRDQAADLFQRADDYWSARVEHIDSVLEPLLGRDKGGEQIVQAVESMSRGQSGGGVRLSKLLSQMTPEEAGQVRATIVDRIGKAAPGAQDASGEVFSASTFLTNWNKMTPQAKASLFSNTKLRNNLNDLALLAERSKATQAAANHSNTGMALYANLGTLGGQGYLAVNHPVYFTLGVGAQYLTGKLLASPTVARALARSAKMPPEPAKRTLVQQLAIIAAREPMIAQDARNLSQALNDNFAASAAAGQQQEEQR